MSFLCLDLGQRRIGVAVSDPSGVLATPWGVLPGDESLERLADRLRPIIQERGVEALVVGLPAHLNGDLGPEAERAELVAAELEQRLGLAVHLWDERLTTAQATRLLVDAGVRRGRRKKVVDKLAATLILQGFLDSRAAGAAP